MPICIDVMELQPGMRLFQAVCNEYTTLLPAGKVLQEHDVDALRRKYPDHVIRVCDPLLDVFCDFENDGKDAEAAREVKRSMGKALAKVHNKVVGRAKIQSRDIVSLENAAVQIMKYLNDNPVTAILLSKTNDTSSYLEEHSANVFYVSMIIGNSIKQYIVDERERTSRANRLSRSYALNLTPLGLGCLMHDVGMLGLEDIYQTPGELSEEQRKRLLEHPVAGEQMLPPETSAVARMVVRTHHENYNGSGYPYGIPPQKQHVFSRIIRAADAFDAATSPRVYKKAKSEIRVLWEMTDGPMREHYDPIVTKVLLSMVRPLPIGAKVKLNNGQYAVVVRNNSRSPYHPQVVIAFDQNGERLAKDQLKPAINLHECRDLRIIEYAGEDLSYLYTVSGVARDGQREKSAEETFSYVYP